MFCPNCGAQLDDNVTVCAYCGKNISAQQEQPAQQEAPAQQEVPAQQGTYSEPVQIPGNFVPDPNYVAPIAKPVPAKSNPLLGIVGAILFGLIACVVWVLIGMLGYISYIGGLLMGFCTVTGYRLLGKKFDIYGIICCIIVILLAVLASNMFIVTMSMFMQEGGAEVAQLLGYGGFGDVFFNFFEFIGRADQLLEFGGADSSMTMEFVKDLVIGYVLSAVGFAICAIPQFKTRNVPG